MFPSHEGPNNEQKAESYYERPTKVEHTGANATSIVTIHLIFISIHLLVALVMVLYSTG